MNKNQLVNDLWSGLPATKYFFGRGWVDALTDRILAEMPTEAVLAGDHDAEMAWRRRCHSQEKTFGPIFFLIVAPIIQYIITQLIKWIIENRK